MKHWLAIFLICLFGPQALALGVDDCQKALAKPPVPVAVRDAFLQLRSMGLGTLMAEIYDGKVEVSVRRQWLPFQPAVSARIAWNGKKYLVIRQIDVSTPLAKQKFLWQLAIALFELQMQPSLWSPESVLTPNGNVAEAAIGDDEDALAYFAVQMPEEWRELHLDRTKELLTELYVLFLSLGDLKAEDFMAATDPGNHWILKGIFLKNASLSIAPNVADFTLLKSRGALQFWNTIDQRHSRSLLFNYYMNHVKRMMIATSIASTLMLSPYLMEIPSYMEAHQAFTVYDSDLQKAPQRAAVVEAKTMQHLRSREIERLRAEIQNQKAKFPRDEALVSSLSIELQALVDKYPQVLYTEDQANIKP